MVEVVVDVRRGLDEAEAHAFAPTSKYASPSRGRSSSSPAGSAASAASRSETRKRDVLERAALARAFRVEERELAAARVRRRAA